MSRAVVIVALIFAAIAPTLTWPQFSGDSEDLLVQTVLEMRHGGPWWIPTLGGHPRTRKPPLAAWISAAAVSPDTVLNLSSTVPTVREAAYRQLAWEVRWPALLAACLMLLAVGWMADSIGGPAHVLPSILIAASSLLFLRYIRVATTDVYLALWVTVANACFAVALLKNRPALGYLGGGAALGLALMSKGPVALVETIPPIIAYLLMLRRAIPPRMHRSWPIFTGSLLMLLIALPWPISTMLGQPGSLQTWLTELKGEGAKSISHDPWYAYWMLFPNLLPWLPLIVAGVYLSCTGLVRQRRIVFALALLTIPIIVLSFFHDRKERYLLPMIGPAAILAAHGAVRLKRAYPRFQPRAKWVWDSYWGILLIVVVGIPAYAIVRNWERALAFASLLCGVILLALGYVVQRRFRLGFIVAGVMAMLMLNASFMWGWSQSDEGLSEMKPLADHIHATSAKGRVVYYDPPPSAKPVTLDLDIYLDRIVSVSTVPPPFPLYDGAAAIVMLWNEGDPEPVFPGWRKRFELESRKHKHRWVVLEPSAAR
jgi:4-amino-4-deoxy-L-arabinose transferase-like glycosyltransferase